LRQLPPTADDEPRPVRNPVYERLRQQAFSLTWLTYVTLYLTRRSFAVAKVAFEENPSSGIDLTREQLGLVDSSYLVAYALGQFMWGAMGDRFGPGRVLKVGLILSVVAAVGSGFSSILIAFAVFAVVQGIGQSTGWPTLIKTMSAWFSARERGRVMGWWCTSYAVGAAIAAPFAAWMMRLFGSQGTLYWPAGFWGPAFVLFLVFLLVVNRYRDRPEDVGLPSVGVYHGEASEELGVEPSGAAAAAARSWGAIGLVIRQPAVWLLALCYFSIKLTRYAFDFWGPMYISESLGSGTAISAITSAALPIGGIFGVLTSGYLSDGFFQSRRAPVAALSLGLTVAVLLIGQLIAIPNAFVMGAFFFAVGFFLYVPDALVSATAAMDRGTSRGAGTAAGFINGVGSIGAVLGGYLPGVLTTSDDWSRLFYVFIAGLIVSIVVILPLWDVGAKTEPGTSVLS
jgi:OPA family sugar phosphate sensor protein UhpC-like MFS transporter